MKQLNALLFIAILSCLTFDPEMAAQAASVKVDYSARIMGFPVGKLELGSVIRSNAYEIQATGRLAGVAGFLSSGKGSAVVTGSLRKRGDALSPITKSSFQASVSLGKSGKQVRIETVAGNITVLNMEPPSDDSAGRIPVLAEHKKAVLDPLSAIFLPMRGADVKPEECNRTIPVFDGVARINIVMTYAETQVKEIGGYKGPILVCHVRYVPIAGHRPNRRVIKYMEENRDISVWLAPVDGTKFLLPLRISVKTIAGTAVLEAEKFSVITDQGQ